MAAPRPDFSNRTLPSRRSPQSRQSETARSTQRRTSRRRRTQAERNQTAPTPVDARVVRSLPQLQAPAWLTWLLRVQQASSVITALLVIAVLGTYGWTVYIQERWGKEYRRLESLEKHERQMVATNEVLKNQMAQQAENPALGLMLPDPANTIYLSPAPQRPAVQPKATSTSNSEPIPAKPLGY